MTGIAFTLCALLYAAMTGHALLLLRLTRGGLALAGVGLATAGWAAMAALAPHGQSGSLVAAFELLRLAAWLLCLLHLFDRTLGRAAAGGRMFAGLCLAALAAAAAALGPGWAGLDDALPALGAPMVLVRLLLCIGGLLMAENLFRNADPEERWHVKLPCIGLGALLVYDVLLVADAALFRRVSPILLQGRPVVTILVAPLLALSAWRDRRLRGRTALSRRVVLHTASLAVSGVFLVGLAAAGEVFRRLGANWGVVAEVSLIFAGLLGLATLLTSGSARGWLRFLLVDTLHTQRFDYGREWARCIDTLSANAARTPLHERVLQALCGIVDSPGGALFLREAPDPAFAPGGEPAGERGTTLEDAGTPLHWAGSWNQPACASALLPGTALLQALAADQVARATGEPGWPSDLPDAWLAVPLRHGDRLLGAVLAARPRAAFRLDDEVAALLRIAGREGAAFLAEHRAAQALIQTRELRNRAERFAFVAHDIKNLSSQLSMLLSNAERHMDNPAFRSDMLETIRASVGKIGTTLARLQEPTSPGSGLQAAGSAAPPFSPGERLERILAERCDEGRSQPDGGRITLQRDGMAGETSMPEAGFDAAINHLLDNALEASDAGTPVRIELRHEGRRATVDIVDRGSGMSPEFVRDRLFRPFASSKPQGHGIGAFQARSLLREAGGDLAVLSAPGRGTTMRLALPLVAECRPAAAPVGAPSLPVKVPA